MKKCIAGLSVVFVVAFASSLPAADSVPAATPPAAATVSPKPEAAPAVPRLKIPDIAKAPASEQNVVGVVDITTVARTSEPGKAATNVLKAKTEKLEAAVKSRVKELTKFRESLQAKAAGMTQAQKLAAEKELRKKTMDVQQFEKKSQEELQKKDEELSKKMKEKIEAAAARLAKEKNYLMVIRRDATLYFADKISAKDVTADIVKLLNEEKKEEKKK